MQRDAREDKADRGESAEEVEASEPVAEVAELLGSVTARSYVRAIRSFVAAGRHLIHLPSSEALCQSI